jgi:hypothetical protein
MTSSPSAIEDNAVTAEPVEIGAQFSKGLAADRLLLLPVFFESVLRWFCNILYSCGEVYKRF